VNAQSTHTGQSMLCPGVHDYKVFFPSHMNLINTINNHWLSINILN